MTMRVTDIRAYKQIVDRYIREFRPSSTAELLYYQTLPSLKDVVEKASLCKLSNDKTDPHQYRIPEAAREAACDKLLKANLSSCNTFDELHQAVYSAIADIPRIGPLTVYDIAHRIGAFLHKEPDLVYLHSGTAEGAKALGLNGKSVKLAVYDLPSPFHKLKAYEIEDCLCLFRDEIRAITLGIKSFHLTCEKSCSIP